MQTVQQVGLEEASTHLIDLINAAMRGENVVIVKDERSMVRLIPIDAVVMPLYPRPGELPLLIEAKSAGDFTKPNKRQKEEATKISQLRATYGQGLRFILFLCGYFDSRYLSYEAEEGIDWVWEHRISDFAEFGL